MKENQHNNLLYICGGYVLRLSILEKRCQRIDCENCEFEPHRIHLTKIRLCGMIGIKTKWNIK